MIGWWAPVVLAGLAWASPEALFPSVDEVARWNADHADIFPAEFHPPSDDAAWLSCMLCRSTSMYIDQVRRLPQISCPTLAGGVDVTCAWLARNKSSPSCHNLTDNVSAIKKSLEHGDSIYKVCRDQMHMCGQHESPLGRPRPTLAEPRDAVLGGYQPKCMQCWVAVHYVNDTRRHRDLPVKAIQIGTQIVCDRGVLHRHGCHALTRHVPAMLEGLKNGLTAMDMCRHMHFCHGGSRPHDILPRAIAPPRHFPTPERAPTTAEAESADPPKVETSVGVGIGWACAIMAFVALLYCAFAKPFRVDPTSAYIAIPHEE